MADTTLPLTKESGAEHIQQQSGGKVLSADSKQDGDKQLFRVKVLHDDGKIKVYQLDAATEGSSTLQAPVVITALIKKLTTSLDKEYQGKHITYQSRLDPTLTLSADEGNMR